MMCTTLALAYAMAPVSSPAPQRNFTSRTLKVVSCFAINVLVGWPFAGALSIPFVFEELFMSGAGARTGTWSAYASKCSQRLYSLFRAALWPAVTLIPIVIAIDSFFYGRLAFVSFNIFAYNVLSDSATLYGVEPLSYYFINLFLNFNVAFPLALFSLPALLSTHLFNTKEETRQCSSLSLVTVRMAPVYVWLALLFPQPHKEERFMSPIYPLLCFNAAIALSQFRECAFALSSLCPRVASSVRPL